ncbi:hypothetical protein [Sanguibacter sp. HDW7]|uniref:hypothetical protein n=1 Tax=Sanguibacter sp. HDW7 TaxID=2714931 RepID=UPI00140A50F1|nr:hypothetical protein [Sanguibacter sp. HDW7]QIK82998.1 hypothetical protein G7063_04670 [Sanguibacter sp. HDW7]
MDGWAPGWEAIGAIGSAFAAGVALWLATRERADRKQAEFDRERARDDERRRRRRANEERLYRQARAVALWNEARDEGRERDEDGGVRERFDYIEWTLENFSAAPIFEVAFQERIAETGGRRVGNAIPVLRPGERAIANEPETPRVDSLQVTFRDVAGTRWTLDKDGLRLRDEYDAD